MIDRGSENRHKLVTTAALIFGAVAVGGVSAQDAMFVDSSGNVGVGTNTPARQLHVVGTSTETEIRVTNNNGTIGGRVLYQLENNGGLNFRMVDTSSGGDDWSFLSETITATPGFSITRIGSGAREMRLTPSGNLLITGTLTQGSSRTIKGSIVPVDTATVLAKLESLPISEWNYLNGSPERHIGPMAEDFYKIFGLGPDRKHISPGDLAGVALAATKQVNDNLNEKDAEITQLKAQLEELQEQVELLTRQVRNQPR